jgi:excisionase family DNA binding protein
MLPHSDNLWSGPPAFFFLPFGVKQMSKRNDVPAANGNHATNGGAANKTPVDVIRESYTPKEAAALLGLRAETLRGWCASGRIRPVYNLGSSVMPRYRIPRASLLEVCEVVRPLIIN